MADQGRHAGADMTDVPPDIADTDFFELLRRLETETMRFGRAGGAEADGEGGEGGPDQFRHRAQRVEQEVERRAPGR